MKKILMVCEAFGGGVFTYVTQLCNDMCDEFDVYLAYALRPQTPENYKKFLSPKVQLIKMDALENIKNLVCTLKVIKELHKIEKNIQPDIIHLHSSIAGGLGRVTFKGINNAIVYTPHGYAHILMGQNTMKSKIYKIIERVLGSTNSITLTCCKSEDDVAKTLCKKTAYINTGVNLEDLSRLLYEIQPAKNKKFTVFTLGRICAQKQPQVFNRIAELVPHARFIWVGSGELELLLTAPNVEVTGWKTRKEALAIAKGSDAFILCSLGEAIAMSLIENMFIRKLCLVSNVMGNSSVIKNGINGYICEKVEEYAEKINDAMVNFPTELSEQAYQDVLNIYNVKTMKTEYAQFYRSLH